MKFQAVLSWFSRNRLVLDPCAGKPVAGDLNRQLRDCAGGTPVYWRGRDAQLTTIRKRARGPPHVVRTRVWKQS